MANENDKLQELVEKVHSGLDLISDEDLNVLFHDTKPTAPSKIEEAPPAPASAEPAPPAVEAPKGQANLMDLIPAKFIEKDEAESLKKMTKSYAELEAELTRKSQELSQLQSQKRLEVPTPEPQKVEPKKIEEEVDDSGFFDSPSANAKKIAIAAAKEVFNSEIKHYDTFSTRRSALERFRDSHPDFENFRGEVVEVCRIHPEWDQDVGALPKIYEAAKSLAIEKARKLNPAQSVNVDELTAKITAEVEASAYERARKAIMDEIQKRKSAAGIITSTPDPVSKLTPQSKTEPLTHSEEVFKAMMEAGPKNLGL